MVRASIAAVAVIVIGFTLVSFLARRPPSEGTALGPSGSARARDAMLERLEPLKLPEDVDRGQGATRLTLGGAELRLPVGARQPRGVILVLVASQADRARECQRWFEQSERSVFVLCPDLVGLRSTNPDLAAMDATRRSLRAALKALKQRFDRYVAKGSLVLVARDEATSVAVALAREEPSFFSRVVFTTADQAAFTSSLASIFVRRGGERWLFVCPEEAIDAADAASVHPAGDGSARSSCRERAALNARLVQRVGGEAKSVVATADPAGGAAEDPARLAASNYSWLVGNDARYAPPSNRDESQ